MDCQSVSLPSFSKAVQTSLCSAHCHGLHHLPNGHLPANHGDPRHHGHHVAHNAAAAYPECRDPDRCAQIDRTWMFTVLMRQSIDKCIFRSYFAFEKNGFKLRSISPVRFFGQWFLVGAHFLTDFRLDRRFSEASPTTPWPEAIFWSPMTRS